MIISPYFYNILKRASRELIYSKNKMVVVEEYRDYTNKDVSVDYFSYKVNWSCCGAVEPEIAMNFAGELFEACHLARMLNALNIGVDYTLPDKQENRDVSCDVNLCKDILDARNDEMLSDFLQGKNAVARYWQRQKMEGKLL